MRLKFSSQNITVVQNGTKIPLKKTDSDDKVKEKLRQDESTSSNFRCLKGISDFRGSKGEKPTAQKQHRLTSDTFGQTHPYLHHV